MKPRSRSGNNRDQLAALNALPLLIYKRRLWAAAGLLADNRGPLVATWPAQIPAPFRVPINTVFVGGGLALRDLRVGPNLGSDHLPVIAEIGSKSVIAEAE